MFRDLSVRGMWTTSALVLLSACGGGGSNTPDSSGQPPPVATPNPPAGSNPPLPSATFNLAKNALSFVTANRNATPPAQSIAATLSGNPEGGVWIRTRSNGPGAPSVSLQLTNGVGDAVFVPERASTLDAGVVYLSTVEISVCTDDAQCSTGRHVQGSPQTINVTYTVESAVQADVVAPRVVEAGVPRGVYLRGRGFSNVSSVQFGNVSSTQVVSVSETEIQAAYPALAAGRYPVSINGGSLSFSGTLEVTTAPTYAPALLTYRSTPQEVGGLCYDPQRFAIFVAARHETANESELLKYSYRDGAWSDAASVVVPNIRDAMLSADGGTLFVATDEALLEISPDDMSQRGSYAPKDGLLGSNGARFNQLAVANDGYVVVTTRSDPAASTPVYLYSPVSHEFHATDTPAVAANAGVSSAGNLVVLMQDVIDSARNTGVYDASTQFYSLTSTAVANRDETQGIRSSRPALDRTGRVIVLNGASTRVYSRDYRTLGRLPDTTRAVAVTPDATRAYTFDVPNVNTGGELRSFDLTADLDNGFFPQSGASIPLRLESGAGAVIMAISPDGDAVFVAGTSGIQVHPVP